MVTLKTMDSSIISFIVLIFIYFNTFNRSERKFKQYQLFMALILTNVTLIVVNMLSWIFNGLPGTLNVASNTGFNLLLYIVDPLGAMIWVLYADFQVFHDENRLRKLEKVLSILFAVNAAVAVSSLYTGWFFSVDSNNIYHRGDFYWIHVIFCFSFVLYSICLIYLNRKIVEKRHYYALLLFPLPQIIGSVLQVFVYGLSYCWTGMMLSLLIIYFNIQDRGLNTDYLTEVYNRRRLDSYIKDKIQDCTEEKSFSAILIDLNKFKKINDDFGHHAGDEALQDAVKLLRESLRSNDFIARFGGDEFYVILDIDSRKVLDSTVERIYANVEKFNKKGKKPYVISFCMGYDIYDYRSKMKSDDFLKHIDTLMYDNKKSAAVDTPDCPKTIW